MHHRRLGSNLRRGISLTLSLLILYGFSVPPAWSVTLYSVRPKDTLARIAQKNGVSVDRLVRANPDVRPTQDLKVGQILIVPDADGGVAHDDEEEGPPRSVVINALPALSAPGPAPTPLLGGNDADFENIAVVNEQKTRELAMATTSGEHRFELSSRRGLMVNQIMALSRKMIGVPYVWGGTSATGLDCSGFTMRIYRLVGVNIKRLADEQYYQGKPTSDPLPGDLVFFSTYLPGPSHVGIYLGGNYFIHASSRKGVTISSLDDAYFKKRYLGARRFF
ncbi:MAG: peptidoglycan endopeptidase [Proteobacteria bacterium]|nr:peptidoglycan endopeptidase [Pseudomonadota bacterium]